VAGDKNADDGDRDPEEVNFINNCTQCAKDFDPSKHKGTCYCACAYVGHAWGHTWNHAGIHTALIFF